MDEDLTKVLLQKYLQDEATKSRRYLDPEKVKAKLKENYEALVQECDFKPGDFVVWKPSLKNKTFPDYNEPIIVVEILDEPVYTQDKDSGSPYFREKLDLILGRLDSDDDFLLYHYDKRRFKLHKGFEG